MTRFVSISMAHVCAVALFAMFACIGCGGPQTNSNVNSNSALGTPTPATTVNCSVGTTTNDQIVTAIYDALAPNYAKEFDQFNITANKPNVKIIGWSTYKTQILGLAKLAAPGCNIPDTDFAASKPTLGANYQQRIGCPPGHGPCGDICIPEGEPCKVTNGPAQRPSWNCVPAPTPTPTSSPGGSPAPTAKKAP